MTMAEVATEVDPKEAVKLFGRLADKYILLDASAGLCCYSGCTDCEYREPGGGYRMADQRAARPKWIPVYEERKFSDGKEHMPKWNIDIFENGTKTVVTKEEFVTALTSASYAPTLGGPFLSASAATIEDVSLTEKLFDILVAESKNKEKLTRFYMSKRMTELAGEQGSISWQQFIDILNTGA